MMPIGKLGLLVSVLLVSGRFQQEAPRHEAQAVATAASASSPTTTDASRPHATVQRWSAESAEELPTTVPPLDVRHESTDADLRRETLYLIADAGEAEDAALIGQSLYDPDSRVRKAAVEALTGIGAESSADWMLVALGDPDARIRRTAVEALGEIGGDTAKLLLQQSLLDADESVREAAQQMLAEPEVR